MCSIAHREKEYKMEKITWREVPQEEVILRILFGEVMDAIRKANRNDRTIISPLSTEVQFMGGMFEGTMEQLNSLSIWG